jgi:hypothetical protein
LKKDPEEKTNLAQNHPGKIITMQALAKQLVADIEANTIPLGGK